MDQNSEMYSSGTSLHLAKPVREVYKNQIGFKNTYLHSNSVPQPNMLPSIKQTVPFNVDLIYLSEGRLPVLTSNSRHLCSHSVLENEINVERGNFMLHKIGIWLNRKLILILNTHFILVVSCFVHCTGQIWKVRLQVIGFWKIVIFISRKSLFLNKWNEKRAVTLYGLFLIPSKCRPQPNLTLIQSKGHLSNKVSLHCKSAQIFSSKF